MTQPSFESPFLWGIDEQLVLEFDENELDDETEMPFFRLINSIMSTYVYAVKENYNEARNSFEKIDDFWNELDKKEMKRDGVLLDIVYCIIQNTKYHVLIKMADSIRDEAFKTDIQNYSVLPDDSGTLYGCKSAAFSIFYEATMEEAILYARSAIDNNPNCPMWQYLLGKSLRRVRRYESVLIVPTPEEINCFRKAYSLSKDPHYAIYLAVAYQENYDRTISTELYLEIFRMQLPNYKIQLRLARGFIRICDYAKADLCLNFAEQLNPDSVTLPHYRGLYYNNYNNREAAKYFKKAASKGNIAADILYGQCMQKIDKDFSFLMHLLLLLKKVNKRRRQYKQQIMLHIGLEFFKCEKYQKALKYFVQAIQLWPTSATLTNFYIPGHNDPCNVLRFINETFLPKCEEVSADFPTETKNALNQLEHIMQNQKQIRQHAHIAAKTNRIFFGVISSVVIILVLILALIFFCKIYKMKTDYL